ncbi:MAG: CotH kinase family protein, partial [Clostridia bacterium]|nr:CotH kinase family protein [Clostridia bacterium]
ANVVMNVINRVIYQLAVALKIIDKCRIDVDEDSGYIFEYDIYYWNEDLYFNSNFLSNFNYTFKYPDSEDVTDEQLDYIQNAVNQMEVSMSDETYPEYIDVNSFAYWILTHDILGTEDAGGSNMFISKYDSTANSKFKMETPWDFDSIKRTPEEWSKAHYYSGFYYSRLFNNPNYEFTQEYINIWDERKNEIIDKAIEQLDSFANSDLATALDYYAPLDRKFDLLDYGTISKQIEDTKLWFTARKEWMNKAIGKIKIANNDSIVIAGDSTLYYQDLMNENLPLIVINTIDEEEPSFNSVETPDGCIGNGITNVTKVPGQLYIILGNDTIYNTGEYAEDASGMTIKINDNGSAYYTKKSYAINLQNKADLLSRNSDDVYKDNEWILLSDEANLTNNITGLTVSKLMDFTWTPSYEYVNVVMNGFYKGIYLLAESPKMNANCRINVDEDSGYIIDNTPYWWNERMYFNNSFGSLNYTFIYPDSLNVTDEQLEYIQNAVNDMETSFDNGTYPEYIDVNSFASWCLTHDLLGTEDQASSNMFISKYDSTATTMFKMETPWNFETIERIKDDWANIHKTSYFFYFNKLFNSSNPEFTQEFIRIWKEKGEELVDNVIDALDSLERSELATALDYYSPLDKKVVSVDYDSIAVQIEAHKQWFRDRKTWLDDEIAELEEETGIWPVPYSYHATEYPIYDLQGRRVQNPKHGVYIQNGKKYIWK